MNGTKLTAGITALGAYAPDRIVTNHDLERMMDTSDEWITTRTGIKRRHVAADDEFTSDLAFAAVDDLLARHGDDALAGVDMVIVATNTPDGLFPATAALVQERFKLQAGAFDLLAACPGWLYALGVAKSLVEAGQCKRVLAIGAEALTKIVDWNDRSTAVLFGDGAGAVVVEAVPAGFGIRSMVMGADGSGAHHLHRKAVGKCLPNGEPLADSLYMNGREVYKFAVRVMNTATIEAVEKAGMTTEDISLFVPHQANLRIMDALAQRLGLPSERVANCIAEYANTSSATIPLALHKWVRTQGLHAGDYVIFTAFAAGLLWGAALWRWS